MCSLNLVNWALAFLPFIKLYLPHSHPHTLFLGKENIEKKKNIFLNHFSIKLKTFDGFYQGKEK